ncbi:hypothetical protein ABKN59_002287 [Abortiporus biennis]
MTSLKLILLKTVDFRYDLGKSAAFVALHESPSAFRRRLFGGQLNLRLSLLGLHVDSLMDMTAMDSSIVSYSADDVVLFLPLLL